MDSVVRIITFPGYFVSVFFEVCVFLELYRSPVMAFVDLMIFAVVLLATVFIENASDKLLDAPMAN